jgi:NTE family protein
MADREMTEDVVAPTGSSAIDLALSGGGVRAMAFHAGALKFLAEQDRLKDIRHISTVSGGSLLVGLVIHEEGLRWPTSAQYLSSVLPSIRTKLTTQNLQRVALLELLRPRNWRFMLSRANLVVQAIDRCWGINAKLGELPAAPIWSINATTAETGRRFRFKANGCGDYQLGYTDASNFGLAQAMAVSAAFPGLIGPLSIKTGDFTWRKLPRWGADESEAKDVTLAFRKLHLYDGGLYDNLALEPLFDGGTQKAKTIAGIVIVSDAGAPFEEGFDRWPLSPLRVKRWLDLTSDQQRALRVRGFVNALQNGVPGAYFLLGSCAIDLLKKRSHEAAENIEWLTSDQAREAARCPTSLAQLTEAKFDLICRHGYETARCIQLAFPYLPQP